MRDHIGLSLNLCCNRWLKDISNFSWKEDLKSLYEVWTVKRVVERSDRVLIHNPYCAQARLTPTVQFVWLVRALCTVPKHSTHPARLEEVYLDTVQFALTHKHASTVLTWPIANATNPAIIQQQRWLSVTEWLSTAAKSVKSQSRPLCCFPLCSTRVFTTL